MSRYHNIRHFRDLSSTNELFSCGLDGIGEWLASRQVGSSSFVIRVVKSYHTKMVDLSSKEGNVRKVP